VSNQIERLRYYDGEYLRGSDFSDEQAYHVEMRRRLNHRLHLHGIVYGLQLQPDQDSPPPPAVPFFSIMPGMALDQNGREIFVPAPYSLSAEKVVNRAGLTTGPNELWLCYQETQTGLPAAGYRDCNAPNQYTRWQELFQVILKPVHPTKTSVVPADCGGVRLGIVTLDNSSINGWQIIDVKNVGRSYVGIRAQRVITPDEEKDTYDMSALSPLKLPDELLAGYLDVHPGVFGRGNLFVKKNVVVGDDFKLDPADPNSTNLPGNIPATGNLKVTNDLFLNGDFYGVVGGKWFLLKEYIQTLTPVVIADVATVDFSNPTHAEVNAGYITRTTAVSADSKLPNVTKLQKIFVALNEIDWLAPQDLNKFWPTTDPNKNKGVVVSVSGPTAPPAPAPLVNFSISATVGPAVTQAGNLILPIASVSVSYLVVFVP
jgi:hypothetical protein